MPEEEHEIATVLTRRSISRRVVDAVVQDLYRLSDLIKN